MKLTIAILLLIVLGLGTKTYHKSYFPNGKMKSQGWLIDGKKVDYWYLYTEHGTLKAEGHYKNGTKNNWWIYYDNQQKVSHKCQLKNGIKHGYCLKYEKNKLKSAVKFERGKKIKEWFSFSSFKRENKLSDLK